MEGLCAGNYTDTDRRVCLSGPRYVVQHRDLKYPCYRKNSDSRLPLTAFFGHTPYLRRQFNEKFQRRFLRPRLTDATRYLRSVNLTTMCRITTQQRRHRYYHSCHSMCLINSSVRHRRLKMSRRKFTIRGGCRSPERRILAA
jgi:hypothetical protein